MHFYITFRLTLVDHLLVAMSQLFTNKVPAEQRFSKKNSILIYDIGFQNSRHHDTLSRCHGDLAPGIR